MTYITQTQLIQNKILTDAKQINTARIQDLIDSDIQSLQKKNAWDGINYYRARHDILDYVRTYWVDEVKKEDKIKHNNKIPHPFLQLLINQKTSYICAKPVNVTTKEPDVKDPKNPTPEEKKLIQIAQEFQTAIDDQLGDKFNQLIPESVIGTSQKGFEAIKFYIDPNGELRFTIVPAEGCIPIYDTQHQDRLVALIRYYTYQFINAKGEKKDLYKLEYYTDKDVTYWEQQEDGSYIKDPNYLINPAGHFHTYNTQKPGVREQHSWGRVPFVIVKNNPAMTTDLEPIKLLIDSYDKVKSGWINDLEDFDQMIYVLKNYAGVRDETKDGYHELAMVVDSIKKHGIIMVEGEGDVKTLKADIPVEAKEKFLKLTWGEIYYFAEGVDLSADKFGNNPSGVSIEFLYEALNSKADRTIAQLKVALKDFFWFVTKYINMKKNKNYDPNEIVFTFSKSVVTNKLETVQMLNQADLSKQTYYEMISNVTGISAEEELKRKDREEIERTQKALVDLGNIQVDNNNGNPSDPNNQNGNNQNNQNVNQNNNNQQNQNN